MAHARCCIDDHVLVGGAISTTSHSIATGSMLLEGREVVDRFGRDIFDELVAMSVPAEIPTGRRERTWNAAMNRISRFL
jgi:hypothetical protein